jgi:hypothetical protein
VTCMRVDNCPDSEGIICFSKHFFHSPYQKITFSVIISTSTGIFLTSMVGIPKLFN